MDQDTNQNNPPADIDSVPISNIEAYSSVWREMYLSRQRMHDVNTEQIMLGQLFTLTVTMAAGIFISQNKESLLLIGTTFLLYPVLASLLSSGGMVLTSSLHHEIDNLDEPKAKVVALTLLKSLFVVFVASACVGLLAGIIGLLFFDAIFINTILLAILAGGLTGLIGFPLMALVLFLTRRYKANPDDVAPPIETAIFHSTTLVAIVVVSRFIT
jgi:cation transporter-like permease